MDGKKLAAHGGYAFPVPGCGDPDYGHAPVPGMTYRQWLIGIIAGGASAPEVAIPRAIAARAVAVADAILGELEKEKGPPDG